MGWDGANPRLLPGGSAIKFRKRLVVIQHSGEEWFLIGTSAPSYYMCSMQKSDPGLNGTNILKSII